MSKTLKLDNKNRDAVGAIQGLLRSILELEDIEAILAPQRLPIKNVVMPSLISDPQYINSVDPLSPSFPLNAAKLVSKLTRKPSSGRVAVVLRPCEVRALIELEKLKQASRDNLILIGIDCLGAYTNSDFSKITNDGEGDATQQFIDAYWREDVKSENVAQLAPACQMCERPVPANTDLTIGLYGMEAEDCLIIQANGPKGEELAANLNLPEAPESLKRAEAIKNLGEKRSAKQEEIVNRTSEATSSIGGLSEYLADCVNCYNCRVACPVCYCKECVMGTDVFDHDPLQYMRWSSRNGCLKMPSDTVFYHITRLSHMSLSCIGCGQCSNACPNDIPLAELFKTISLKTQEALNYAAGEDPDQALPLSLFEEDEFQEVVGIKQKGA